MLLSKLPDRLWCCCLADCSRVNFPTVKIVDAALGRLKESIRVNQFIIRSEPRIFHLIFLANVDDDDDVDDDGGADFEDGDDEEGESRNFRLNLGCCFDESDLDLHENEENL